MNVTMLKRRVLELLARGGRIDLATDDSRKIAECSFVTHEGWTLEGGDILLFGKLKANRLIASRQSGPYRITRLGMHAVQPAPKTGQANGNKRIRRRGRGA